jgi:hypothetical protein
MMTNRLAFIAAAASALILSSCGTTKEKDKNAPTGPISATVVFKGGSAAYWASATGGSGTLNYEGKQYPFSAKSAGALGTGGAKMDATGEVYNLNSIEDFAGTYNQKSSGFTLIKGHKRSKLTNDKGVVIYADAKTTGLMTNTGVAKVTVKLK